MRQGESAANGTEEADALVEVDAEPAVDWVGAGDDAAGVLLALGRSPLCALAATVVVVGTGAVAVVGVTAVVVVGFLATGAGVRWRR